MGDALAAMSLLDAFSQMNELPFGFTEPRASALDFAMRRAIGPRPQLRGQPAADALDTPQGVSVLVLGSGFGERSLRVLPPLLELVASNPGTAHHVVSLERDPHKSAQSAQLLSHAIGDDLAGALRHLPFMPGEETTLEESLESLAEGWELPAFDVVLLDDGDGRGGQEQQLETLLKAGALRPGAVVHAEGPAADDPATQAYLGKLAQPAPAPAAASGGAGGAGRASDAKDAKGGGAGRPRFETEVRDIGGGRAAVVSVLHRDKGDEL
eukprot:SRR837773.12882.p1 GENE.SRR837773.12882~~SRR837773.12882.p1  ORF type:complete len:306 (-),score=100.55 SRR837773.12882:13-816(-)